MPIRVAGAQINPTVGDISGNEQKIAAAMDWAEAESVEVLLLPELALTGYPPEDLVFRQSFVAAGAEAIRRLASRAGSVTTVVGFVDWAEPFRPPEVDARQVANAAAVLRDGSVVGVYHKVLLPNYAVFDERRYFVPGPEPDRTWDVGGTPVGVSICEDIWSADGPPRRQAEAGAQVLLNINASPFHSGKAAEREEMLAERARASGVPVVYVNMVGGQDELVFDGGSVVIASDGTVIHRSPQFEEDRFMVEVPLAGETTETGSPRPLLDRDAAIYAALRTGLADYLAKNGFQSVVLGVSGGIDSALTATVAADALGPDNVWGVAMPSRYSSQHSIDDARALAENLGIKFDVIPIDPVFSAYLDVLAPAFADRAQDITEENLQARIRGAILMALSNKFGNLVLAPGNKSEMAVGYSTIYGDMVGGYSVLKDVFKTVVYRLAEWRNGQSPVIPENTIRKPPSAELRPDQKDQDSLPPYEVLDPILAAYIEEDLGVDAIAERGFDAALVRTVLAMVDRSEHKRHQSAPGVRVTVKALGKDRRMPITNRFREE